jgi:hypothetical protein
MTMKNENQIAGAIIKAAQLLGNGDAATSMGAIEALGLVHKEGLEKIQMALLEVSVSLDDVAEAISARAHANLSVLTDEELDDISTRAQTEVMRRSFIKANT